MTISKQDVIDSFKAYHADSNLTYNEMTKLEEILQAILSINFYGGGGGGDATAANQLLELTELEEINIKTPALVGGKVPVDIASLSVTVDNANLEISNDAGNPIPISDAGGSLTVDGTVTVNAGTNLNTSLLALESGGNLAGINTKIPATLTTTGTRLHVLDYQQPVTYVIAQLTAPGVSTARQCDTGNLSAITFQVTVANINTSVTVRWEGSLDNTNWFNLDVNDSDTVYTANGTYGLLYDRRLPFVRFNFVSESGGTSATINPIIYVG